MESTARKELADWLTENRYTQRGFAEKLGISQFHVSRILSDRTRTVPGRIVRKAIAAATGLDVADKSAWE